MRWVLRLAASWVTLCTLPACTGDGDNHDVVCPRARAAFELVVRNAGDPLPLSLTLSVGFGGASQETYSVHKGNGDNDVLCCATGDVAKRSLHPQSCGELMHAPDASASDASASPFIGAASELHCQIWTNGAADLTISAHNRPDVHRTLAAALDESYPECSIWGTTLVTVELGQGDAGAPVP